MKREKLLKLLCEETENLKKNLDWLSKSYNICKNYSFQSLQDLTDEQLTNLEALFSRFSRTVDILINKVLRNLDIYELENIETKLDILIRAEKRGFIEDYEELIEMKDLRNIIAHEYIVDLTNIFKIVIDKTPFLIKTVENTIRYINVKYC